MRMRTKVYLGVASVLVAVGALFALNTQAMSSYRDCEDDTIIRCGALTQAELLQKYDQNVGDVQHIYSYYGISRSDLAGTTSQVKIGTAYQDGRVVVDGKTVATNAYSLSRIAFNDKNGNRPRTVNINGTTLYEGPNMSIFLQSVDAYVLFRNGQFYKAVLSSCGNPLIAVPEKPVTPPVTPTYTCDSLKYQKIDRTIYRFTTTTSTSGDAKVVSYTYDFGDGTKETVTNSSVQHTYADKAATYTIKVSVNFLVNGSTKVISGANCQTTITIPEKEKPVTPVYRCNSLLPQLIQSKDRTYQYTLDYTAAGGAELTKVTYNFGDGVSQTFPKASATSVQHTYANAGNYTTVATLYFTVKNGNTTTEQTINCSASITIPKPEFCPIPGKQNLPKNSPECKQEKCEIPGKENLPKNSPECVETPVTPPVTPPTPPELPKTGLENFIGGGLGLGSLIAAGNYWFASRRNLLSALLNK